MRIQIGTHYDVRSLCFLGTEENFISANPKDVKKQVVSVMVVSDLFEVVLTSAARYRAELRVKPVTNLEARADPVVFVPWTLTQKDVIRYVKSFHFLCFFVSLFLSHFASVSDEQTNVGAHR
jgi:hypothetical protein